MSFNKRGSFRGGSSSRGNTRFTSNKPYRGGKGGGRGGSSGVAYGIDRPAPIREDDGSAAMERIEEVRVWDEIDTRLGFERFESASYAGEGKVGWLVNMQQVSTVFVRGKDRDNGWRYESLEKDNAGWFGDRTKGDNLWG